MSLSPLFLGSDPGDLYSPDERKFVPRDSKGDVIAFKHTKGNFTIHRRQLLKTKKYKQVAESGCDHEIDVSHVQWEVLECFRNFIYSKSYFDEPDSTNGSARNTSARPVPISFKEIWECIEYGQDIGYRAFQDEGLLVWGRKFLETGDVGIDDKEVQYIYNMPIRDTAVQKDFLINVYARHDKKGLFNYKFPNAFQARVLNVLHTAHLSGERLSSVRAFLKERNQEPFSNPLAGKRVVQIVEHSTVIE